MMEPFAEEPTRPKKRTGTSKYDFFKVKVWLGDNMDHYYVLSRFLICRMLTVTKIPYIKAVKIALETKKYLVDHNLQDVTQAQLESVLFSIIRSKGFDEQYIDCYRMVTQFYQQRQPLCIIICGTAWTGKSTIAQQLASRINIPNVMQTDVIYELLRAGGESPLHALPLWSRPQLSDASLVSEFRREARVVRKGLDGDLVKTLSDGKPIIIEGMHLDPDLLISDFQRSGIIMLPARPPPAPHYAGLARQHAAGAAGGSRACMRSLGRSQSQRPASSPASADGHWVDRPVRRPWSAVAGVPAEATAQQLDSDAAAVGAAGAGAECSTEPAAANSAAEAMQEQAEQQQQAGQQQQDRQQPQLQPGVQGLNGKLNPSALGSSMVLTCNNSQPFCNNSAAAVAGTAASTRLATAGSAPQVSGSHQAMQQCVTCGTAAAGRQPTNPAIEAGGCILPPSSSFQVPGGQHAQQCADAARPTPFAAATALAAAATFATANSSSSSSSMKQLAQQGQEEPSLDLAPAAAAAAQPVGTSMVTAVAATSGADESVPLVVMMDSLQVDAAAAEAVALQQHRQYQHTKQLQLEQQQRERQRREQQGLFSPISCRSTDSDGPLVGVSPSISQEHSTTEVVSRQPSCGSPALSREQSAASLISQEPSAPDLTLQLPQQGQHLLTLQVESAPASVGQYSCSHEQQQQRHLLATPQTGVNSSIDVHDMACGDAAPVGAGTCAAHLELASSCNAAAAVQCMQVFQQPGEECDEMSGKLDSGVVPHSSHCSAAEVPANSCQQDQQQEQQLEDVLELVPAAGQFRGVQQPLPPSGDQVPADAGPSCGASSSSRAAAEHHNRPSAGSVQQGKEGVSKPLFVPILVYMDEADHALMAEEALPHYTSTLGPVAAAAAAAAATKAAAQCGGSSTATAAAQRVSGSTSSHITADGVGSSPAGYSAAAAAGVGTASRSGNASSRSGVDAQSEAAAAVGGAVGLPVTVDEALRRMRLLQEYLCAYEAQGLPVVKVSYGNFSEALDKLHEYILQCIKVAMECSL